MSKLEEHAASMVRSFSDPPFSVCTKQDSKPKPETAAVNGVDNVTGPVAVPVPATLVNTAAGAAGSLAGWAISTLGKRVSIGLPVCISMTLSHSFHNIQLATTDMQTPINSMGGQEIDRSTSAPPIQSLNNYRGEVSQPHFVSFKSSPAVPSSQGAAKGNVLRLGANKTSSSIAIDSLVNTLAEEAAASATIEGNPWGSDDLIDVNADNDDWGGPTPFFN